MKSFRKTVKGALKPKSKTVSHSRVPSNRDESASISSILTLQVAQGDDVKQLENIAPAEVHESVALQSTTSVSIATSKTAANKIDISVVEVAGELSADVVEGCITI